MSSEGGDDRLWLFKSVADESDIEAVTEVLNRGTYWIEGPNVEAFENGVAALSDREYGVSFNSGTSALFSILDALDVAGREVIVPSLTYPATANAVVAAGGKPVFADVERETLALSADEVLANVTEDTAAIVPVHFSGNVASDIYALQEIAADHDLELVEDAAHSLGASLQGNPVGSFGTAAMYSFSFNKTVTTGEGGMVVTDSESLEKKVRKRRRQGRTEDKRYVDYGYNLQMSSLAAALGVSQMDRLDEIIDERRRMATYLNDRLGDLEALSLPEPLADGERVYLFYNLCLRDSDQQADLRQYLDQRGIPTQVSYEPVHLTEYYRREWGYRKGDLPTTESVANRIVTLPFHLDLSEDDLQRIVQHVRAFFGE